ncbi:uncharacterized protein DEA37_0011548, partial [Paragonimus westermani]
GQKCCRQCHKEDHCRADKRLASQPGSKSCGRRFQKPFRHVLGRLCFQRMYVTLVLSGTVRLQVDAALDITNNSRRRNKIVQPTVGSTTHNAHNAVGGILRLSGKPSCAVSFGDAQFNGSCYLTGQSELDSLGMDWTETTNVSERIINHWSNIDPIHDGSVLLRQVTSPYGIAEKMFRKQSTVFRECFTKTNALVPSKHKTGFSTGTSCAVHDPACRRQGILSPTGSWYPETSLLLRPVIKIGPYRSSSSKSSAEPWEFFAHFFTGFSAFLDMRQYPLPLSDLFAKMRGGKFSANLVLTYAYLQMEVSESSKELLTISTHHGLLQYQRLPLDVNTALAIFQQIRDTMLTDVPGAAAYLVDIVVAFAFR